MATVKNLTIDKGSTWEQVVLITALDGGAAINLTGYTARMHIRPTYTGKLVKELTTENGCIEIVAAEGKITLSLTAEETSAIAAGTYLYDLETVLSEEGEDDIVHRRIEGKLTVTPEVTR